MTRNVNTVTRVKSIMQISACAFSRDKPLLTLSSSSWSRKGDPLTNRDFLYKCEFALQKGNFYSVFRASLSLVFLKTILTPRGIFWVGWRILVSYKNTKCPSGLQMRGLTVFTNTHEAVLKISTGSSKHGHGPQGRMKVPRIRVGALLSHRLALLLSLGRAGRNPASWKQFHKRVHFGN